MSDQLPLPLQGHFSISSLGLDLVQVMCCQRTRGPEAGDRGGDSMSSEQSL